MLLRYLLYEMLGDLVYTIFCEYISDENECIKILEYFGENMSKYEHIYKEYDFENCKNNKIYKMRFTVTEYKIELDKFTNLMSLKVNCYNSGKYIIPGSKDYNFRKELQVQFRSGDTIKFPKKLQHLEIDGYYGHLKSDMFPSNLQILILRGGYWYNIQEGVLPTGLKILHLNKGYTVKIKPGILPESIQVLKFFGDYNKRFEKGVLPKSLCMLKLSVKYKMRIGVGILPESVRQIYVHALYRHRHLLKQTYPNIEIIYF